MVFVIEGHIFCEVGEYYLKECQASVGYVIKLNEFVGVSKQDKLAFTLFKIVIFYKLQIQHSS